MNTFGSGEILYVIAVEFRRRGRLGLAAYAPAAATVEVSVIVIVRRKAGGGGGVAGRGGRLLAGGGGGSGVVEPAMVLQLGQSAHGIIAVRAGELLLTAVHLQVMLIVDVIFGAVRTSNAEKSRHVMVIQGGRIEIVTV